MLYDEITMDSIVDSDSALEFMKEATKLATSTELEQIGWKLEVKSRLFQKRLDQGIIRQLDEEGLTDILNCIFGLKRKTQRLIGQFGMGYLQDAVAELLYGEAPVSERFNTFIAALKGMDESRSLSFGSELLHFVHPGKYWLWTPWIWDRRNATGALVLVTQSDVDLNGDTPGDQYEKVGRALMVVNATGQYRGYSRTADGMFGTDIFLACVYAVYMYTVFKMKLSQEFNRILPELPELTERVLGVHKLGSL